MAEIEGSNPSVPTKFAFGKFVPSEARDRLKRLKADDRNSNDRYDKDADRAPGA